MAVTQEGVQQQPPGTPQAQQAPNSISHSQPAQPQPAQPQPAQPQPAQQVPPGAAAEGQAPSPEQDFSKLLEQHISQAIQPVLDEFRQQLTQVMEQQAEAMPAMNAGVQGAQQEAPQGQATPSPVQQSPVQQSPVQQPPVQQPLSQAVQTTQAAVAQPAQPESQGQQHPLSGALAPALQTVERHGEQWIQSLLITGLTALLTESSHATIQQRAEHGLHTLLQKLFEAVPDGMSNQEMLAKTEQTLQAILREALNAVFAEGVRTAVQQNGQEAIRDSLHGDFREALTSIEDTLKAMADALIAVLRRQWPSVLRLLLALVLLALASSLAQSDKQK